MEQLIQVGEIVPMFRLPDAGGRIVSRQQYRGRANLLLLLPPDLESASQQYLRRLSAEAARWSRDTAALVIARAAVEDLAPLAQSGAARMLADVEGKVRARFLPTGVAGGWLATDRWGELYAQGYVAGAHQLPPPAELRGWLEFIACECAG